MPEDIWERDLRTLKELNFSHIRLWVNWREVEPYPDKYNFSDIERLLELAKKLDLKVIVQVYLEFAPDWLPKLFPDSLFTSEEDVILYPQGSPGICLDNPKVRLRAEKFLKELARTLVKYDNFQGWDVWSEPQIVQWIFRLGQPRPLYCYCEHSKRRFREWLRKKYRDIDNLNKAWHRIFGDFDEVEPPRFLVLHYGTENIDWITFNIEKLREDLEWRYKTIRDIDKEHVITSHAATTCLFLNPLFGQPDDWEMAKVVDIWGTSLYPKHAHRIEDPAIDGFILDAIRSSAQASNKEFWVGELQGGQGVGGLTIKNPVNATDLIIWLWQSIAHGAKGINVYHSYPMMWGYESSGYGLLNLDGSITERAKALSIHLKIVREYEDLFMKIEPLDANIALLYNGYTYRMLWIFQEKTTDILSKSFLGIYRIFFKYSIPIEFLSASQLEALSFKHSYKVIIAPLSIALSRSMAEGIRNYVDRGGLFITDTRFGWFKEDGWMDREIPAYGLRDVMGAKESFIKGIEKDYIKVSEKFSREIDGIPVLKYLEVYEPIDAEPIGYSCYGPSMISHKYGNGMAVWVGGPIGYSYEELRSKNIERFLLNLVSKYIMRSVIVTPPDGIEVRILAAGNDVLTFIINHRYDETLVSIDFKQSVINGKNKIIDLISGSIFELKEGKTLLHLKPRSVIVGYLKE
ncbi:MAG: beta-galactosidase [Desulfurococcaceae archaeon]